MNREPATISLTEDDLRVMGLWAADCAERALPVFEARASSDPRPREAIEGLKVFANGGKRTVQLRSLAWAAYAAAREVNDPAAAAAARAAGLAAAIAYTHPLVTSHQTRHTLGPAAYAALARELAEEGDYGVGDTEVQWAVEHASAQVRDVVRRMPERGVGRGRLDTLLRQLDVGLRGEASLRDA